MYQELRNEINALLSKGTRMDGRKPEEYRKIEVELGVSKNAEGSARVKIGDTEVMAGVKLEVMKPYPDAPDRGSLMVNVELYPMSSPEFESGPPNIDAIEMARVTDRCIRESKMIDVEKLLIEHGEKAWMVVIDICTMNEAGNLFDAIPLAALCALKSAVYPSFDGEVVDYKNKTDKKLPISVWPVSVTVYKYGDQLLIDPSNEEERVYDARLTVGVYDEKTLCSLQKGGDCSVSHEDLLKMIDLAMAKSKEIKKALDSA